MQPALEKVDDVYVAARSRAAELRFDRYELVQRLASRPFYIMRGVWEDEILESKLRLNFGVLNKGLDLAGHH